MKNKSSGIIFSLFASNTAAAARAGVVLALLIFPLPLPARAADRQIVHTKISGVVTNLTPLGHSSRWTRLNLSIGLPLRDREGLTNLLQQLYDRSNTNYHHFLTTEEFTARFGPTEEDYQAVVHFAQSHGLAVTGKHSNRMLVDVSGDVASIERALNVSINEYQHPAEKRKFYAPGSEPSLDLAVPVLAIGGLDNYIIPHPCMKPLAAGQANPNLTGSGPGGTYMGNDFRAAYVPGVPLTGTGQTVGLLEFDSGYYQSDVTAYENLAGLPNVPVSAVLLDGYSGGAGEANDEVSLDIEMAISMAPGLEGILVYEGSTPDDILNRMATDNLAKTIGSSWNYGINATSEQIFQQYAAQGQSYFNASGDGDAYPGAVRPPSDDPNVTVVGGTTLTTTGPGGAWVSEKVWNSGGGLGSGGGISAMYSIPSWQQGLNMTTNEGSTTMRNLPDVAMTANNVYVISGNGQSGTVVGTSCATPLWAAFTALANQLALTNGEPTVGFINPAIYAMGKGSNILSYTALFHDISTGNNEWSGSPTRFSAVPGFDLCTGWGTPTGSSLVTALALPELLRITPLGGAIITGPVGGPFTPATQTFTLTNNGPNPLNWSLVNTSSWFNVTPTSGLLTRGGSAATVAVTAVQTDANLPPGSYTATILFTNVTDGIVLNRRMTLAVVTPPVITAQPTNEALLVGMTANFSVSIATNALMFYQWQESGANLSDGGQISGSATSTLTIQNVTVSNDAAYSVILSNAAGVLVSSNANLTIVPSPPVIVLQPTNQLILPGAPASFSVAAVGNTPYYYRWQFNGTSLNNLPGLSGATNSTLVISNAVTANAGTYSVVVSNTLGSVTSTGAVLSLVPVSAPGYGLSTLWSFTGGTSGEILYGPLTHLIDGTLIGTTIKGGAASDGTVFTLGLNGGSLTTLFSFTGFNGAAPYAGLCFGADGSFYGTTSTGTTTGDGNVFRITTGRSFTALTTFNGNNGADPVAGLMQANDGNFYGTTYKGGDYGDGTVFRITTGGTQTSLVSFNGTDGALPSSVLIQGTDGNLYGTTEEGGTNGVGTIFKMTPSGVLTVLHSFTGQTDGEIPIPGLVQGADGNFYGATYEGGTSNSGTVFQLSPSGTFKTFYSFTGLNDGGAPRGGLVQASDGNLYGTTQSGGTYGDGTVFQISPSGTFTTIAQFDGYNGANPSAALMQDFMDGNLYGTTEYGGSAGGGTVFRVTLSKGPLEITGQPVDQSSYVGGSAVFTVATSGGPPLHYHWQQDGINLVDGGNITGSATATLRITNVTLADAALYSVVVTSATNSLVSDYAALQEIYSPANITLQPVSQTTVAGTTVGFSVGATGDQPLAYQWQLNGTNLPNGGNISGVSTSTLTINNATLANNGSYSVIVSNALYAVSSGQALLTVVPPTSPAASMTTLQLFSGGVDGAFPYGGVIQGKDGYLYGTTRNGGSSFDGSVFKSTTSGGLTSLVSLGNNFLGTEPFDHLVQGTDGNLYGTASSAGTNGDGTVFRVTTSGTATPLYSFTGGVDGSDPVSSMVQASDGNFYGTALEGGGYSYGSVFKMSSKGVITVLYGFTNGTDGAFPYAGLVQGKDGHLYGTTFEGGASGYGTVYSLTTNGTLTTLASFGFVNGAYPKAGVIQGTDGNLYGTTFEGGSTGNGTVFCLATNGTLTTLCSFNGTNGSEPIAALVQATDGNFYGTTSTGGAGGQGTAFEITTNGVLTTLIWFDGLNGASPQSALIQANDGAFYGTTVFGGTGFNPSAGGGYGTLFRLVVPMFINNPFAEQPPAIACLSYSATLVSNTIAPPGDSLACAKVSGPGWLNVATSGALSGTPTNSDIGTNVFVVSTTDTNGVLASATMNIVVSPDPPPSFLANPFSEPWANLNQNYAADIATNATAPYINQGDMLTFAKVSGPAWLNVAGNGVLSGGPEGFNAGTNTFTVSVTDLGGSSNTATLFVYVDSPPIFSPENFVGQSATAGIPYSGTIVTNVVDVDAAAGDVLTFYKVTGPSWLNVAANGLLSGTSATSDVGTESFLLLVVNSGGLAGIGNMTIKISAEIAPVFVQNPFNGIQAFAGQNYSGTIATNANDPNFDDRMTFAKISGPTWLNVAANGSLSGMPLSTNAGANTFVVSVVDLGGLSDNATFVVNVTAIPIVAAISQSGNHMSLTWSGGVPPYQVQTTTNLAAPVWQNLGDATSLTNRNLVPNDTGVFYRVQGQ